MAETFSPETLALATDLIRSFNDYMANMENEEHSSPPLNHEHAIGQEAGSDSDYWPEVDGDRVLNFERSVVDLYECCICLGVVRKPVKVQRCTCLKAVCHVCIEKHRITNNLDENQCPTCRTPSFHLVPDRMSAAIVDKFLVSW